MSASGRKRWRSRANGAGSTASDLPLAVDFVEELGATQLFYGALGGASFVLQAPTGEIAHDVKSLPLRIAPDRLHIFDARAATGSAATST